MTEDQLEQETLAWLQDVGYTHVYPTRLSNYATLQLGQIPPEAAEKNQQLLYSGMRKRWQYSQN